MDLSKNDIADRFGYMWRKSRQDAKASQDYMAKALGVSKKTIQNWEAGYSSPSQMMGFQWFYVLGLQPLPYYLDLLYGPCEGVSEENNQKLNEALQRSIDNLSPYMKRKLLFILDADHGSSTAGVLDMVVAHLNCPIQLRIGVAQHILDNYEIAGSYDLTTDHIKVDTELLRTSINNCKKAVKENKTRYSNIGGDFE